MDNILSQHLGQQAYNPAQWYWLADDGRVFSGPLETVVTTSDSGYVAWVAAGNPQTAWPRELDGNQTDAALQDVLTPHGMFVNLSYYAVDVRWRVEQGGMTISNGMPIKTDDRSQAKINGLRLMSLPGAMVKEGEDPLAQPPPTNPFTTEFWAADYTLWTLNASQILMVSNELQALMDNTFDVSADVLTQIQNGTVTTRDQVNSMFGYDPNYAGRSTRSVPFPKNLRAG